MDNWLKELFGIGDDKAADATTAPAADDREARHEARRAAREARRADPERQGKRQEFADRYLTGDPSEGFSTEEALAHIREMYDEMGPTDFRKAMQQTIEHLPEDKRADFVAFMRKQKEAMRQGQAMPAAPAAGAAAPAAGEAPSSDAFAGLLTGLLGGSAADTGASRYDAGSVIDDLMKGGLKSPTPASKQPTEADFQALINSPLARAVLGGIAAYGMQGGADDRDAAKRR